VQYDEPHKSTLSTLLILSVYFKIIADSNKCYYPKKTEKEILHWQKTWRSHMLQFTVNTEESIISHSPNV